jgi:hypothetical protein
VPKLPKSASVVGKGIGLMSGQRQGANEGYDSRRWTGDPNIISEPRRSRELRKLQLSDVPQPLRALVPVVGSILMVGLLGNGYCEHELFHASSRFPNRVYTEPRELKGSTRFVTHTDGQICAVSTSVTIGGGAASFLVFGAATVLDLRRRSRAQARDYPHRDI